MEQLARTAKCSAITFKAVFQIKDNIGLKITKTILPCPSQVNGWDIDT